MNANPESVRIDIERFIEGTLASAAAEARGERALPRDLSSWWRVSISDGDVSVVANDRPVALSNDDLMFVSAVANFEVARAAALAEVRAVAAGSVVGNVFLQRGGRTAFGKQERARRPSRWPVVLCGLLAIGAACAAVLTSPLAKRPAVQRVASATSVAFAKIAPAR